MNNGKDGGIALQNPLLEARVAALERKLGNRQDAGMILGYGIGRGVDPEHGALLFHDEDSNIWIPGFICTEFDLKVTASGGMEISSLSVQYSNYALVGDCVFISIHFEATIGGNPANSVRVELPFPSSQKHQIVAASAHEPGGNWEAGIALTVEALGVHYFSCRKHDSSNWTLGSAAAFSLTGFYRRTHP